MKILILANNDIGLYKFRKELIEALLSKNHEVYISLPYGQLVKNLEQKGCVFIDTAVDRRGLNPIKDIGLMRNYMRNLRKIKPDLVITYTIKPNIYGGLVSRILKIPYAVNITGLGTAFQKNGMLKRIIVFLYKVAMKAAKVVFFENSQNREEMISLGICPYDKTYVLNGAGVNLDEYPYLEYLCHDTTRFLFIGRVMKEKGIDELFDSMKKLINDKERCFLDVVGPCEENYEKILMEYEQDGWLKYHGYQEDIKSFVASADCYVLPSWHEGMANTNLECAASGRPVITSNIAGCQEAIISGKSGFLCECKNVDSLYDAMKEFMRLSYQERKNMGIEGRKHMEEIFDKRKVVAETIKHLFG